MTTTWYAMSLTAGLLFAAGVAFAADEPGHRVYAADGKYEDVRDDLKDAIINRGFVVDHVGHLSAMLDRTAEVIGSGTSESPKSPYKNAEYLQFCPLNLTHEAVQASLYAIANCPISIFVFESKAAPGKIHVGYRLPSATESGELRQVNEKIVGLLDALAKEAVGK